MSLYSDYTTKFINFTTIYRHGCLRVFGPICDQSRKLFKLMRSLLAYKKKQ